MQDRGTKLNYMKRKERKKSSREERKGKLPLRNWITLKR